MTVENENRTGSGSGGKATWAVMCVYEDDDARKGAVQFCDALVKRFWAECGFDVTWQELRDLEAGLDQQKIAQAAQTRIMIFALSPQGELSPGAKAWIECWLGSRGDREGMLVGLNDPGASSSATRSKFLYLRSAAVRGGMDYLTVFPQALSRIIPDSYESYSKRADEVTSVLDEILNKPMTPTHLLL
jgi:hypothetical protein